MNNLLGKAKHFKRTMREKIVKSWDMLKLNLRN